MPSTEATTIIEDHDNATAKRPAPLSDVAGDFGGVFGSVLSNSMGEPRDGNNSRLSSPLLSRPVNTSFRSIAFKHAQQTYGNHFVQRLVGPSSTPATDPQLIQRQCACGACEKCDAASASSPAATNAGARESYFAPGSYAPQLSKLTDGAPASVNGLAVGDANDPMEREADRVAEAAIQPTTKQKGGKRSHSANGAGASSLESTDSGSALPGEVREKVEPLLDADFSGVRVHDYPEANKSAAGLNARAFTVGNHIWLGSQQSTSNVQLMAHELTHTVQQSAGGRPVIRRWTDPTTATLTPEEVLTWSGTELTNGISLLLDQAAPVSQSVEVIDQETTYSNLRLIINAAVSDNIEIPDNLLERLPAKYGPHGDQYFALFAQFDLMDAMLHHDFPDQAAAIGPRLEHYRTLYPWLDSISLENASNSLELSLSAVEAAARIHRVVQDPGGDAEVTAAVQNVFSALTNLLDALLRPRLPAMVSEAEAARDEWLNQLVAVFGRTIDDVREKISPAIFPWDYGHFADGINREGLYDVVVDPAYGIIGELEDTRLLAVQLLDELKGEIPDTSQPLESRLDFIAANNNKLDELIALAEKVLMGEDLCRQGQILADGIADSDQINKDNLDALGLVGRSLLMLVRIDYPRARMDELRQKVGNALQISGNRIADIRSYEKKAEWLANIVATITGMRVMKGVMAIPAVAGLGRTGATIVGSLAFTTTRLVLTNNQGRPLSAGGFVEDAAKDYLLLRLLGGVDARITARVGETGALATAARFGGTYGTLVGWSLTWKAIQPGAPGPMGDQGPSTGDVMVQTGVDLAVLSIADSLTRAPVLPETSPATPGPNPRNKIRLEWEAVRSQLQTTGQQLREWTNGPRENVKAGDSLLESAAQLFTRTKDLHARFAEIGELSEVQRTELDRLADAMQESIRNARDEVRLDVRAVTAESWSYRGAPEDISTYLQQLKVQGRVEEVTSEGNGIFSIVDSTGALHWFFPAGRNAPVVLDIAAEAVEAAAPGVPEPTRSQALLNLRGADWSDLGSLAGGLPAGRGAPFIEWAARPDVGQAIAKNQVPLEVMKVISQGTPEQIDAIGRDDAHALTVWSESWQSLHSNLPPKDFMTTLLDIIGWRGTMAVSGAAEAKNILSSREGSAPTSDLTFQSGPTGSASGSPAPVFSDLIAGALKDQRVAGADYKEAVMQSNEHFVIELVDGKVTRMFEIAANGRLVRTEPVATNMTTLHDALSKISSAANETAAHNEIVKIDPILRNLEALLDFRQGVPPEQIHLLEVLVNHPLRLSPPPLTFGQPAPVQSPPAPTAPPPRTPRRIVVTSGSPKPAAGEPQIAIDQPAGITRKPTEAESRFVDRFVEAEERAYWETIGGRPGTAAENPARWARVQPTLERLVAAMRNMQARLVRARRGNLLPEVLDGVLQQSVDLFIMRNPVLRQARMDIEAQLRADADREGRSVTESPEWNSFQEFLGRGGKQAGASPSMGAMKPDIVEFLLEDGRIHISDVTIQAVDSLSVHQLKTRVYVEIMKAIVGPRGPKVFGQDIQIRTDITGQRIDPTRTKFGEVIE